MRCADDCHRRPATFEFVKPSQLDSTMLRRGVPQVDSTSVLLVSNSFHTPPAEAVSHVVEYPFAPPVPQRLAGVRHRGPRPGEGDAVVPANSFAAFAEAGEGRDRSEREPVPRRHPGQRALG